MIIIQINRACAAVKSRKILTSGMVGAEVHFVFDEIWNGLIKTAVFRAGDKTIDVLDAQWEGDVCTVPHEVLAAAGVNLEVGVYGTDSTGKLVIPTVYADCGKIRAGADPSGDESTEPTAPVWAQLDGKISDVSAAVDKLEGETVKSVNSVQPDENGNVVLGIPAPDLSSYYTKSETDKLLDDAGTVKSVNGTSPDESGNVVLEIPDPDLSSYYTKSETDELLDNAGTVKSVNGVQPDESGNVVLEIPDPDLSVYYTKTETDNLLDDFGTVKSVNSVQPDESGNVTLDIPEPDLSGYYTKTETDELLGDAGTVKSVNSVQPDESGNVTLDIPEPDLSVYYTKTETDELLDDFGTIDNQTIIKDADGKLKTAVGGYVGEEEVTITWDGDTTDLNHIATCYKVSDLTVSSESLLGCPIEITLQNAETSEMETLEDVITSVSGNASLALGWVDDYAGTGEKTKVVMIKLAEPNAGIYLLKHIDGNSWVSKFTIPQTVVHKIDSQFLPEIVTTIDADSTDTSAASAKAVYDAIQSALTVDSEEEVT